MSYEANRRRLTALFTLMAIILLAASAVAVRPLPAEAAPGDVPSDMLALPTDFGNLWELDVTTGLNVSLIFPQCCKVEQGGRLAGSDRLGASVKIDLSYLCPFTSCSGATGGAGQFEGTLSVYRIGKAGSYKTHVFLDGKEIDSFMATGSDKLDVQKLFGNNLEKLAKANKLRLTMDIDGKSYTIFEIDHLQPETEDMILHVSGVKGYGPG